MSLSFNVGVGGAWKPIYNCYVGVGGAWKPVLNAYVGQNGSWVQFFAYLSASINSGSSHTGTATSFNFGSNSVTIVGGIGPFTYQWHESDNGQAVWTPPGTSSSQGIVASSITIGTTASASYYCVVTDTATGVTATTNTASYIYINTA